MYCDSVPITVYPDSTLRSITWQFICVGVYSDIYTWQCGGGLEISSRKLSSLFRPGSVHSGSASWDDCDRAFSDKLCESSFPDRIPHSAWTVPQSAHSHFNGSRVYVHLGITCHLQFWQNDRGLLHATAVRQGWNGHWIRVSTQSWPWRRKFSRCSCQDSNSQPFDHESGVLTNKLSYDTGKKKKKKKHR